MERNPRVPAESWDVDVTSSGYVCTDAFVRRIANAFANDSKRLAALNDPDGGKVTLRVDTLRVRAPNGAVQRVTGITRLQVTNLIFEHTISDIEGATLPPLPECADESPAQDTFSSEEEAEPLQSKSPKTTPPALAASNDALKKLYAKMEPEKEGEKQNAEASGGGMQNDFGKVVRRLGSTSAGIRELAVRQFPDFADAEVRRLTTEQLGGSEGQQVLTGYETAMATKEFTQRLDRNEQNAFRDRKNHTVRTMQSRQGRITSNEQRYALAGDADVAARRGKLHG